MLLTWIIIFSLAGGLLSLVGGVALLFRKKPWSSQGILTAISFAAGVLLAVAFGDLLPEAIELAEEAGLEPHSLLLWSLAAVVGFFLFERSFVWFHHHHGPHEDQPDPVVSMVLLGDTLHNFIDGLSITASFMVSIPLGITTSIAVAAHELPQEIADFSLFLSKGMSKKRALLLNILSSLATLVAALLAFYFWDIISIFIPHILAFTAGMFIYIASSDLIPELHRSLKQGHAWLQVSMFLVGILGTLYLSGLFHA